MSFEQLVVQYGVAGAVLVAIWMFLKCLKEERKDRAEERHQQFEERTRFLDVLEKYRMTVDAALVIIKQSKSN